MEIWKIKLFHNILIAAFCIIGSLLLAISYMFFMRAFEETPLEMPINYSQTYRHGKLAFGMGGMFLGVGVSLFVISAKKWIVRKRSTKTLNTETEK